MEEILNMQSKPESQNVIYLNYDGETIVDANRFDVFNLFGFVSVANRYDIDGSIIEENNRISSIKFPSAASGLDRVNIFKQVANKYDVFDVNVTDERAIYNSASGFKKMAIITSRPTLQVFNQLTIDQNKSESGPWPYSYRRFLRARSISSRLPRGEYTWFEGQGVSGPPDLRGYAIGAYTQYVLIWTNSVYVTGLDSLLEPRKVPYGGGKVTELIWPTNIIARTIAHEIGHHFGLDHDGQLPNQEYYMGHPGWVPIMGIDDPDNIEPLCQWSKLEYAAADHVYPGRPFGGQRLPFGLAGKQDDLIIIGDRLGFIKSPKESISKTEVRAKDYEKYETRANQNLCWEYMGNLGVYTRVLSQEDVMSFNGLRRIEGMIGFPGDFEILKILLPKGTYQFTIDPVFQNPESMLDIDMSILNCHCHRPKEKYPVNCNSEDLPTRYPTDLSSENFQCISFNNCLEESKYDNFLITTPDSNGFTGLTMTLTLSYTQIVYLSIAGHKQLSAYAGLGFLDGWSVYSSVGKYYLEIVKDGVNNPDVFLQQPSTAPLPVCNCEEFETCHGKVVLFTQEDGENQGTENMAGAHIRQYQVVVNGQLQTKKFLVYGPPLDLNTDCPDGKFCLPVYDTIGQACVKQEFVVGGSWEQSKL